MEKKSTLGLIDEIIELSKKRVSVKDSGNAGRFIQQLYESVAAEDLLRRTPEDLCALGVDLYKFAVNRKSNEAKFRIFNPDKRKHGWSSTRTVIELVNDDMPFLVDSLNLALNKHGLSIQITMHPIISLQRDARGRLKEVLPRILKQEGAVQESIQHVEIERERDAALIAELKRDISKAMADLRVAITDWGAMCDKAREVCNELTTHPPPLEQALIFESKAFLDWMVDRNFTFLGYREYRLESEGGKKVLIPVARTGLGILRRSKRRSARSGAVLSRETLKQISAKEALVITKANSKATVHRRAYLDYIGVKLFDRKGRPIGEKRFLGLFTSLAYNQSPREIPLLRHKVRRVMARSRLNPTSHAGKALIHILDTFPRDELFQCSVSELVRLTSEILNLQERRKVKLLVRRDTFERFYTCIVYIPRDRYHTEVRKKVEAILLSELNGESVEAQVRLSESILARVYYLVRTKTGRAPEINVSEIEEKIVNVVRSWEDALREALVTRIGEESGLGLFRRFEGSFPAAYMEDVSPQAAAIDVLKMDNLSETEKSIDMSLYRSAAFREEHLRFKLFRREKPIPIFEVLPMLENMGLKVINERPYSMKLKEGGVFWMQDFEMAYGADRQVDPGEVESLFKEAFRRSWRGEAENDGFNKLVLAARLNWRQTALLRACCKYLLQIRVPFSQSYMEATLNRNARIAQLMVELFEARFALGRSIKRRKRDVEKCNAAILKALDAVASLDEDRILRGFHNMINACLRTNYFQRDSNGREKPYLSLKLEPSRIPDMPLPLPLFEIFVYSPRVEGVHLRGGRVARGGLRWSDRREDFRTEVLGLVKAQMVKNTIIVPVGAKGGFVVKRPPQSVDKQEMMDEVVACYRNFVRGLLDLTDNLVNGKVVPPRMVVRHDEDDPYLVVAADKGTATFSDIANALSQEYGFWLGDAFASGGSVGYDHKKMGITAKGAWESVKRLFRDRGINIQTTEFTVVGIGDMSGDVFGNGMLQSRFIKLQAAFNHMHIFLDPDANSEMSFAERERLFNKAGSTWEDYDRGLLSKGGGVYSRSEKQIRLSPEAKAMLEVEADAFTPQELIRAILRMPVDLLWNGGIGTYFKAKQESHSDVGDRANDGVRVNGEELRSGIVGEGGNLGFTQLSRVEYAFCGGLINTDFIDNSGGVDCSDREVNIKILLNIARVEGLLSEKNRRKLLRNMTDTVTSLVLLDNYRQSQAISMMASQSSDRISEYAHLIRLLEQRGELNRELEFLPLDEEISDRIRTGKSFTRPELAVLLAYGKLTFYSALVASDVPEDPYFFGELQLYFPDLLRRKFGKLMGRHPLYREIISLHVTSSMVHRMGPTFTFRMREENDAEPASVARAYTIARDAFKMREVWKSIEALDHKVPADVQYSMMYQTSRSLKHVTRWLLQRPARYNDIASAVALFQPGVAMIMEKLTTFLPKPGRYKEAIRGLVESGVSRKLAQRVAGLKFMYAVLDIVEVAKDTRRDVKHVAAIYFMAGDKLSLNWISEQIEGLTVSGRWQAAARGTLRENLFLVHRLLTTEMIGAKREASSSHAVEEWLRRKSNRVSRLERIINDMKSIGPLDFATVSVALQEVRKLVS